MILFMFSFECVKCSCNFSLGFKSTISVYSDFN